MKTKIINTILQWAPECLELIPEIDYSENTVSDYLLLHHLAEVCVQKINSKLEQEKEWVLEKMKIVNMLYQGGNQYTRNAIENEFLTVLSSMESPASLKLHMDLLPAELRKGYIKTILEN